MSDDLENLLDLAVELGLGARLQALIQEVEGVIADYPQGADRRYLHRLEDQLDRLRHPDLRLLAALVRGLCESEPACRPKMAPLIERLAPRHPYLRDLLAPSPQDRAAA